MPRDIYFLDLAVCAATENTVLALFIHGTLTQATELVIHGNKKKFTGEIFRCCFNFNYSRNPDHTYTVRE
jgi:hypothetical protein